MAHRARSRPRCGVGPRLLALTGRAPPHACLHGPRPATWARVAQVAATWQGAMLIRAPARLPMGAAGRGAVCTPRRHGGSPSSSQASVMSRQPGIRRMGWLRRRPSGPRTGATPTAVSAAPSKASCPLTVRRMGFLLQSVALGFAQPGSRLPMTSRQSSRSLSALCQAATRPMPASVPSNPTAEITYCSNGAFRNPHAAAVQLALQAGRYANCRSSRRSLGFVSSVIRGGATPLASPSVLCRGAPTATTPRRAMLRR